MTHHTSTGQLHKMKVHADAKQQVLYDLVFQNEILRMNDYLGKELSLDFLHKIECIYCHRQMKKSFNQGYCYPCFTRLARCDLCIMKPEKCHYHQGTCREPDWGEKFCMVPHCVYLANSSNVKIGITRLSQIPTRWIDQGAIQALPIFTVKTRQISGFVEDIIRQKLSDKTNWRKMLQEEGEPVDLYKKRNLVFETFHQQINQLNHQYAPNAIEYLKEETIRHFHYPVIQYPTKVNSLNLDKNFSLSGQLLGIKGQYLILDSGVLNIRKFAGYHISISIR